MENNYDGFLELLNKLQEKIEDQKIVACMSNDIDKKIIDLCEKSGIEVLQSLMFENNKVLLVPKGEMKLNYNIK